MAPTGGGGGHSEDADDDDGGCVQKLGNYTELKLLGAIRYKSIITFDSTGIHHLTRNSKRTKRVEIGRKGKYRKQGV